MRDVQKIIDLLFVAVVAVLAIGMACFGGELQDHYETTGIYAQSPIGIMKSLEKNLSGVQSQKAHVRVESGMHSHTCPKCGNSWSHGASSFGSTAAHRCAKCGTMVWDSDPITRRSPVVKFAPVQSQSRCPNGNCPVQTRFRRR